CDCGAPAGGWPWANAADDNDTTRITAANERFNTFIGAAPLQQIGTDRTQTRTRDLRTPHPQNFRTAEGSPHRESELELLLRLEIVVEPARARRVHGEDQ